MTDKINTLQKNNFNIDYLTFKLSYLTILDNQHYLSFKGMTNIFNGCDCQLIDEEFEYKSKYT